MIEKQAEGPGSVTAIFRLPPEVVADTAAVVGEFNGWSTSTHAMTRDGDSFAATIPLAPGRRYRFRYLLDGQRWENDWAADAYVPNEFGGDDSVIDLTTVDRVAGNDASTVSAKPEPRGRRRTKTAASEQG